MQVPTGLSRGFVRPGGGRSEMVVLPHRLSAVLQCCSFHLDCRELFSRLGAIPFVTTDSDLIRRSSKDPQAFAALYDKYSRAVYRYAATRAGDSVAEDVMSQTFLVAYEDLEAFDQEWDDARPWLFGIATNLLRRHHRTEARRLRAFAKAAGRDSYEDGADRVAERLDAAAKSSNLAAAIKTLSTADRECLLLYAWADLTYEGIALATGVPVGTVRSRLNRARRIIRDAAGLLNINEEEIEHGRAITPARNA
jgi:RNA polymerase sigma factor (sigma-70 family)